MLNHPILGKNLSRRPAKGLGLGVSARLAGGSDRGSGTVVPYLVRAAILVLVGILGPLSPASACTTPVYRYAMYNWASSPFVVCYLHRGEPDAQDEPVNRLLREAAKGESTVANIVLEPINLDQWQPEKLPPPVREALESKNAGALPIHVIMTPWGAELAAERLDERAATGLLESPARKKLGELLDQGNAAVLLLLPGKDAVENERVEGVIRDTIAQAASGKIPVSSAEEPMPGEASDTAGDDAKAAANRLNLATITVGREDAAEKWLVQSLMKIEPDLHEYIGEPMVFAVYGRGRSMEPYVGKGITSDNLCGLVAFLAGACSCMVKEQNPGVDLLFRWDWESTADRMAENDPTLSPPEIGYQEVPMGDSSGAGVKEANEQADSTTLASTDVKGMSAEVQSAAPAAPATTTPAPATGSGGAAAQSTPSGARPVAAAPVAPSGTVSLASRQMWTLGAGAAVAGIAVLTAGLVLLRRRRLE
ncbi:MAG: hypothetical protein HUU20_00185 [Pirellulales bacterium]|nr:hypothetical protein [Pirellulales bacterium]